MANVLIEKLNIFNQVEKALNKMLGSQYWTHDGTTTKDGNGNILTVNIKDLLAILDDGNGNPTTDRVINADRALLFLDALSQDQLDDIKGRFGNIDLPAYIRANMVDQSTITLYRVPIQ